MNKHDNLPNSSEPNAPSEEFQHQPTYGSVWRQNHGNFLAGFVASILVVGTLITAALQLRFVPPRFPDHVVKATPRSDMTDGEASNQNGSTPLTVEFLADGADSNEGKMMFAIYADTASFNQPEQAISRMPSTIEDRTSLLRVEHSALPPRFAVAVFHDSDGDGKLNRNAFGIPTEPYGFSRDARALTGPPTFEQAVIERPKPGSQVTITLK